MSKIIGCLKHALHSPPLPPGINNKRRYKIGNLSQLGDGVHGASLYYSFYFGVCFEFSMIKSKERELWPWVPGQDQWRSHYRGSLLLACPSQAWILSLASLNISVPESKDLTWNASLRKVEVTSCSRSAFQRRERQSPACLKEKQGNAHGAAKQHLSPALCRAPGEMGPLCPEEGRIGVSS